MEPSPWDGAGHPDSDLLRRFALGLLGRETADRVGHHLLHCDACYGIGVTAPDDRLLLLLRRMPVDSDARVVTASETRP